MERQALAANALLQEFFARGGNQGSVEADRKALHHMAISRDETPRVLWANIQGALASLLKGASCAPIPNEKQLIQ